MYNEYLTFCDGCETYRPSDIVHRYGVEGERCYLCDGCLHDRAVTVDCEHEDGTDHIIWAEHAVNLNGQLMCFEQALEELAHLSELVGDIRKAKGRKHELA